MTRFNFIGPLHGEMFRGLTNLTSLDLSFSYFESINLDAFEYLKNLRNLTMTSCVGFDVFPSQSLRFHSVITSALLGGGVPKA